MTGVGMHVKVVPYDLQGPSMFATASAQIRTCLGEQLLEIHHIGSTAIPQMHAKPIIDMRAIVLNIELLDGYSRQMESIGYEVMGEFGILGRRYFRRNNAAGERTHQIHAFEVGLPHIERHLAFRDYMRTHAEPAEQYAALKRKLAEAHPGDIEAYMDGKDSFIKETEARALAWVANGRG